MEKILFYLRYSYKLFFPKKNYNQKYFPLGYIYKTLKPKKKNYFYFLNPYIITPKIFKFFENFYTREILTDLMTVELFKSNSYNKSKNLISKRNGIISIASKIKSKVNIDEENESKEIILEANKNYYLKIKKNKNYKIRSNKKIFVSKLQPTDYIEKDYIKLNLIIFIDGLSSMLFNDENKSLLQNTKTYFSDGIIFKNHFCNSEWSLPSGANTFTGCHFQKHGLFHNNNFNIINDDLKLLPELFDEKNYMTCMINGSHRLNPSYNFSNGFKRILYKKGMTSMETLDHFLDFEKTFSKSNKFVWLTFMDLHEAHNYNSISANHLEDNLSIRTKIRETYNPKFINEYKYQCENLDQKLKILYDHLSTKYQNHEILISLISDHAQTFFDNDQNILKNSRIKIPWLLKGKNIKKNTVREITENIDIFPSFAKLNNIEIKNQIIDGDVPEVLGGKKKLYSITQSIYPNQSYKCRISFDDCFFDFETIGKISNNGKLDKIELKDNIHKADLENKKYKIARDEVIKKIRILKN